MSFFSPKHFLKLDEDRFIDDLGLTIHLRMFYRASNLFDSQTLVELNHPLIRELPSIVYDGRLGESEMTYQYPYKLLYLLSHDHY